MAGFLYYIAGGCRLDAQRERLEALGLAYAFDVDRPPTPAQVMRGPGPGGGVILADPERAPGPGYYPERQRWTPATPGDDRIWVGHETAAVPGPDDLLRTSALEGDRVRLGDCREWIVPRSRQWQTEGDATRYLVALPQVLARDDTGKWVLDRVKREYLQLAEIADRYWDARFASEPDPDEPTRFRFELADDAAAAALVALATNYALGPAEVELLELFDSSNVLDVLDALVDFRGLLELQKKRSAAASSPEEPLSSPASDSPPTSPGRPAETLATSQPSPTG